MTLDEFNFQPCDLIADAFCSRPFWSRRYYYCCFCTISIVVTPVPDPPHQSPPSPSLCSSGISGQETPL